MSADIQMAIAAAKRARESAAGSGARPTPKGQGKGQPLQGPEVLNTLLRDYLQTKGDVTALLNAKVFAIILRQEGVKEQIQDFSTWWHSEKAKNDQAAQNDPGGAATRRRRSGSGGAAPAAGAATVATATTKLPYKKVFLHGVFVNLIEDRCKAILQKHGQTAFPPPFEEAKIQKVMQAAEKLKVARGDDIDYNIGSLRSRYSSHKAGKPWKFELTFSDLTQPDLAQPWMDIIRLFEDPEDHFAIEARRVFQTPAEQQLWSYLKALPRA